jgi:hypothetical protein
VTAAAGLAKVTRYQVELIQPHLSWVQELFQQTQAHAAGAAVSLFHPDEQSLGLAAVANRLDPVTRDIEQLARFSVPGHLYAYCFCQNN